MRNKSIINVLMVSLCGIVLVVEVCLAMQTSAVYNAQSKTIIFIILASAAISFGVAYAVVSARIRRKLTKEIADILHTLDKISAGDLGVTVETRSNGELDKLSFGINNMLSSINAKTSEVAEKTDDLRELGAIVAIADAGIIVKDREGVVQKWNIGAETLIGYKAGEMIGKSTKHYAPEFEHAGIDEIERRLKKGEHIAHVEVVRQRKGGQLIDCSASYTPIFDDNMNFTGSVAIFHDISDKKRIEHALKDAVMAAEHANSAKSSFLANMSHEIRTPMNGIIGFSELALDEINDTEKTADYLNKIKISAESLMLIINDILDISKIEAGKMELENIPFNLHDAINLCETICSPKADEKGVGLYVYAEPDIPQGLYGDPIKLRQIMLNLLANAVKFTHKGTVRLTARVERRNGSSVTIGFEVKDNGIGMSYGQMQKVFGPFVQADSSTTREYGGTGLGLTIAKDMIELMGGELHVESAEGKGSKFSFSIPFEIAGADGGSFSYEEKQSRERPVFSGDVLVCEDNDINRQVIKGQLSRVGLNVTVVENGSLGVEAVKNRTGKPFDLILMDIHMPVMDGVETSKKLIKMGNTTPIVALTANAMAKDRKTYLKSGMSDFLAKPFTAQDLWACLLKHLPPVQSVETEYISDTIKNKAPRVCVVDRQRGIQNSGDDEELYSTLLARFAGDNAEVIHKIKSAVRDGDMTLAHRTTHTLKGLADMLGAERLKNAALTVEKSLSDGVEATVDEMHTLESALEEVLTELAPFVKEREESNA